MASSRICAQRSRSGFHPASLDAINFLLADVRGALGPYLNVFLVTQQHWSQEAVGLVTTISGLLGLTMQTPIGAAINATCAKRGVIVLALIVLAAGATVIFAAPNWPYWSTKRSQASSSPKLSTPPLTTSATACANSGPCANAPARSACNCSILLAERSLVRMLFLRRRRERVRIRRAFSGAPLAICLCQPSSGSASA